MDHLFGWVEDRVQVLGAALAQAQRAAQLDGAASRPRSLLGFIHIYRRDMTRRTPSFARPSP